MTALLPPLHALVEKWRSAATLNTDDSLIAARYGNRSLRFCADELEALLSRAVTTQVGEEHPAYDQKSDTFNVPADLMRRVWNTIDLYANSENYRGERTGGVLQGCPRKPDPTHYEMSLHAYETLQEMIRWRWPKEQVAPSQPVAPDGPYKIERHGKEWALYSGRSSQFHGWNLALISEPAVGILELIEAAMNAFAAAPHPAQPSSDHIADAGKMVEQEPTAADWVAGMVWARDQAIDTYVLNTLEEKVREIAMERKA